VSGKTSGPSAYTIERVVATWQRAREKLAADPDLADDEMAVATAYDLDPESVHPDRLIERLVTAIAFASARQAEAKWMQTIMATRRKRYEARLLAMRTDLFNLMELLKYKKYPALAGTVSIKAGVQSVLVTDEQAIPAEYFRTVKLLNKKQLLADLKEGVVVDGALLSNGAPSPQIRGLTKLDEAIGELDDEAEERDGEGGEPAPGADNADGGQE
jgi:Siphovirus Gp157